MKVTKNFIKMIIIFYFVSAAIYCGNKDTTTTQSAENEFSFQVQFFIGDVKIIKGETETSVTQGDQVNINDIIITKSKSYVDILYGTSGIIRVNENSKISIAAIADDKNNDTIMNMEKGKILAAVSKLKGTKFNVKTPTVVASVRGTSFSVENDKSGAKVTVVKGTVSAAPVKAGDIIENKAVDVQENHRTDYINEATVDKIAAGKKEVVVTKMSTTEITALQNETKEIKSSVVETQSLTPQEKTDLEKELQFGSDDTKAVKPNKQTKKVEADNALAEAEKQKKIEEEKKKAAEAAVKQKEEQTKKERISNIPTM